MIRFMAKNNGDAFKAKLVTKGRISGKNHAVWLRGVMYEDRIYFSRHRPDSDWFKNALVNNEVLIQYDGLEISGKASLVTDENLAKKISELKYPGEERAKEHRVNLQVQSD